MTDEWDTAFNFGSEFDSKPEAREKRQRARQKATGRRRDAPRRRAKTDRTEQLNFRLTPKLKAAVKRVAGKEYGAIAELMEAALMVHPKVRAALGIEGGDQ